MQPSLKASSYDQPEALLHHVGGTESASQLRGFQAATGYLRTLRNHLWTSVSSSTKERFSEMPLPRPWKPSMTPAQHSWLLDLLDKPFQQLRINISEPMTHGALISTELPARHPV